MMAGAQTGGTAGTLTIPQLNETQRGQLFDWINEIANNNEKAALLRRAYCVLLAGTNRWDAERTAQEMRIPEQAVSHYFGSYQRQGLEGLGTAPPGGEKFTGGGQGQQSTR